MTVRERPFCDRPEPYACYAGGCACQPCQVKRACLQKVLTPMARTSPGLFDLVEAWGLESQDDRH